MRERPLMTAIVPGAGIGAARADHAIQWQAVTVTCADPTERTLDEDQVAVGGQPGPVANALALNWLTPRGWQLRASVADAGPGI